MSTQVSKSLHWQSSITTDGEIVEGFDDVEQAISIILSTPLGNVPHRPLFGCDILPLMDGDFDDVAPLFIARATDAILKFEPRIEQVKITATQFGEDQSFAGAVFNIVYTPIDSLIPQSMTYKVANNG